MVHINAGIAGLVAAIVIGKRKGYPKTMMPPHSMMLTLVGAAMLWVGWFGFNAGSELAADGTAGMAMAVTQIATAAAAFSFDHVANLVHGFRAESESGESHLEVLGTDGDHLGESSNEGRGCEFKVSVKALGLDFGFVNRT